MDRQQIETLHEQASERYLEGDYSGALQMWDRLLAQNPTDQRAQEGVRLCRLLAETSGGETPPSGGTNPSGEANAGREANAVGEVLDGEEPQVEVVQDELDVALSAFDGLRPKQAAEAQTDPRARIPEADTSPGGRSPEAVTSPGIDEAVTGSAPAGGEASEGPPLDFDLEADLLEDPKELLDPSFESDPDGTASTGELEPVDTNPAADELRNRIRDLMDDARTAAAEGRREQALSVLGRLFILDEHHAEGRALERSIREEQEQDSEAIDRRIAEGVQLLEGGNRDGARDVFLSVLDSFPNHVEARAYLEQIDSSEGESGDPGELRLGEFAPDTSERVADHGAVDLGGPEEGPDGSELSLDGAAPAVDPEAFGSLIAPVGEDEDEEVATEEPDPALFLEPEAPERRSSSRGLLVAVFAIVVLAGGGFAAWKTGMLDGVLGSDAASETAAPAGVAGARSRAEAPVDDRSTEDLLKQADRLTGTTAAPPTGTDSERFEEMMRRGQQAIADGDYAAAVLAFNEAIEIDPDQPDAARAFLDAGRMYRARQMQLEELHRAEQSFQAGDYVSALRSLYRLPEDLRPRDVHRYKVNAWYNLGVVSLRAGDTRKAMEHLDEVLAMEPEDAGAKDARAFAERWDGQMKDRIYYADVDNLEFRGLDS